MTWDEVREHFPKRWVVVEAIGAYDDGAIRIIPQVTVAAVFGDDWWEAWQAYENLHRAQKDREFYPIHTDREEMDIGIIDTFVRIGS